MRDSHKKISNGLTGIQDSSSGPTNIAKENFIDALNIGVLSDNKKYTLKGNKRIFANLASDETCIGAYEDTRSNSIIYFLYSKSLKHKIIRWFPDRQTISGNGVLELVAFGRNLAFKREWIITHIELVDNKFLYWTDAQTTEDSIEGNPPRMLDISRSVDKNKNIEYLLAYHTLLSFQDGYQYSLKVYDINHNVLIDAPAFYTAAGVAGNHELIVAELTAALAPYDISVVSIEKQAIKIFHNDQEKYLEITSSELLDIRFYTTNSYNFKYIYSTWTPDYDHNLIKEVPLKPFIWPNRDTDVNTNNIENRLFQFICRYNFTDNTKSAWSDVSEILSNITRKGGIGGAYLDNDKTINSLNVTIPSILDFVMLSSLKNFEVAVKDSDSGVYKKWKTFKPYEVAVTQKIEAFYNDATYSAIGSDGNAVAGTQVLKNYDFVPELSGSLSTINDEKGNSVLLLGANLEGKINIPVTDVEITQEEELLITPNNPFGALGQTYRMSLKRNGRYDFTMVYKDDYGRRTSAIKINEFKVKPIPSINVVQNSYTYPKIKLEIKHLPPKWAKYFEINRSDDMTYSEYTQILGLWYGAQIKPISAAAEVECLILHDIIDDPSIYDYVGIRFSSIDWDINPDCLAMYTWFKGLNEGYVKNYDENFRIKMVYKSIDNGIQYYPSNPDLDFEIKGVWKNKNGEVVILIDKKYQPNFISFPNNEGGPKGIFEIYKGKTSQSEGNYTIYTGKILNGGMANAKHSGNIQNQSNANNAIIELGSAGDTFYKKADNSQSDNLLVTYKFNEVPFACVETQFMNYAHTNTRGNSYGWLNIEDEDVTQRFYFNRMRLSDTYVPDGKINGLSAFRGLNSIKINKDFSTIKKMVLLRQVLLVIARRGTQPFYVNRKQIIDIRGDNLLGQSSSLLNMALEYKSMLGTDHPESVAVEEGAIYGWDVYQGTPWRYKANGIMEIYYKNKDMFVYEQIRDRSIDRSYVFGIYDRNTRTYNLSFLPVTVKEGIQNVTIPGSTYGFADYEVSGENYHGWLGKRSYIPEAYCQIKNRMVSFKDGELWEHNRDDVPTANYYGNQYDVKIKFAVNESHYRKIFWALRIVSEKKWHTPNKGIVILPTNNYPEGMKSMLPGSVVKFKSGQWWSALLRNMIDKNKKFKDIVDINEREVVALYNGERLIGDVMTIELVLSDQGEYTVIEKVDVELDIFNPTKF